MPASLKTDAETWFTLGQITNKTAAQITQYNTLTTELAPYIFSAEKYNALCDCILNLESFFLSSVDGYIDTAQAQMEEWVNALTYIGEWSSAVTYQLHNIVKYTDTSGTHLYMCIKESTAFLPTNTTYWIKFSVTGPQGEPGSDFSAKGAWSGTTTYSANDLVTYGGYAFVCLQSNTNQTPDVNTDSIYWSKIFNLSISISNTQPTGVMLWMDTSVNPAVLRYWNGTSFVKNVDPVYYNMKRKIRMSVRV